MGARSSSPPRTPFGPRPRSSSRSGPRPRPRTSSAARGAGAPRGLGAGRAAGDFVGGERGGDPAAVAYDAIAAADERGRDVVIVDTAGRPHPQAAPVGGLRAG